GRGGRISAGWCSEEGNGERNHPLGWYLQLAAVAPTLRRRPARAAREARHPGGARRAAGRRAFAGPFLRAHVLALLPRHHAERRHDEPLAAGADGPPVLAVQAG